MPNNDISRVASSGLPDHYSSVRMQQGRVLTDFDWNASRFIDEEVRRKTDVDIIGPAGSPDNGFKIENLDATTGFIDFDILNGTMYTGGLRLEMNAIEKFRLQKDWLEKNDNDYRVPVPADFPDGVSEMFHLAYLEAWQQPVSAVEDSALFEPALGGPDTTVRLRNMRRVRIFKNPDSDECPIAWKKLQLDWKDTLHFGTVNHEDELIPDTNLKVSFIDTGVPDNLCTPSVVGGYLGAENQSIRVQVTNFDHSTNSGHFTWGFDNASPLYRITLAADAVTITMITEPKDQYHWPLSGQAVEILPWSALLHNNEKAAEQKGILCKVTESYNPDTKIFTLAPAVTAAELAALTQWKNRTDQAVIISPSEFLYMRVWNRGSDLSSPAAIAFTPGTAVALGNTGLQVTFTGNDFTAVDGTGNIWTIAARPSTPGSVLPKELLTTGVKPHAVRFYYSPLAIIKWKSINGVISGEIIHDCRKHFHPLTEQECCCTFTVGDGVRSKGDFRSIQEAVDNLPADGGKICILPGIHEANVVIANKQKIHIIGCGEQSIVRIPVNNNSPLFVIKHSQKIRIDNLTLVTFTGIAVEVEDDNEALQQSEEITIRENHILACIHAVKVKLKDDVAGDNNVKIAFNMIGMYDKTEGDVAIFSLADDVLIERNRIVVIPAPDKDPDDPQQPPDGGPHDPCADLKKLYARNKVFLGIIKQAFQFVSRYAAGGKIKTYKALGGIQIGAGSEKIWILQNEIIGGRGNGITLGHEMPEQSMMIKDEKVFITPFIYDIVIEENLIYEMGLSGIGTLFHVAKEKRIVIRVENILIVNNTIKFCVQEITEKQHKLIADDAFPVAAVSLAFCEDVIIRENRFEENGRNQPHAICGLFIFFAENADVSENHIINNGPDIQASTGLNFNVRGGIVIWFATKLPRNKHNRPLNGISAANAAAVSLPIFDAEPAVKIHDNMVTQPIGHALFLIAFGPVSVVSNQFTSQGINKREFFSLMAGTVFIFNLGISKDILNIFLMPLKKWKYVNPSALLAISSKKNPLFLLFQLLPNGKTMVSSNQVTLDMRSFDRDFCISSQMIFSLDDIAFVSNQSECAGFAGLLPEITPALTIDIVLLNTVLFGISTRCNDNRFTDGFSVTFFSLLSLALVSTAVANQSTHCLIVPYLAYRRKSLNIELNVLDCSELKLEALLNSNNSRAADPRFNFVSV